MYIDNLDHCGGGGGGGAFEAALQSHPRKVCESRGDTN